MNTSSIGNDSFNLNNDAAYVRWRDEKLDGYPGCTASLMVELADFHNPRKAEMAALTHPHAMLIPANEDSNGVISGDQSGSVFSTTGDDAALHMRYTAHTRSIEWRDDAVTASAVAFLSDLLAGDSPYIFRHRLAAGEGVLCNNVLHNRTAFEDNVNRQRLFLRARYFDRIAA